MGNDSPGTFTNKHVGTGKTVTTARISGGTDAGDYTLTQPSGLTANITQLAVTVAAVGANKVYDGNTNDAATLGSSGVVAADPINFSHTSALFPHANVRNPKTASVRRINSRGAPTAKQQ